MEVYLFKLMCSVLLTFLTNAEIPSVITKLGTINGEIALVKFRGESYNVDRYLGIPYAKPPTGDHRFKKPEPYGVFQQPFNAVNVPPSCPQYELLGLKMSEETKSEDCLFLNIYVPNQDPDQPTGHAVMFFIHGGGFTMGSGSLFKPEVLASVGNVIVVTINYRLGLLGFLNLGNDRARGNFGLFDQHFALKWVNQNIEAFGGDKDRVTIFGESAGSVSVALQMLYPPNTGLFTSAIAESGTMAMSQLVKDDTVEVGKYFAENMSCSVETVDEVFNCLMSADVERIIKVVEDTMAEGMANSMKLSTVPTIDGDFLRMRPSELTELSRTGTTPEVDFLRSINLINGVNGAEGAMFIIMQGDPEKMNDFKVTREEMTTQQIPGIAAMEYGNDVPVPDVVRKMIEYEYTDWKNPDDPFSLRHQVVKAYGDMFFGVPGIKLSHLHANGTGARSYLYSFIAWMDMHLLPTPDWVGKANHGDELAPVFGYNFDYELLRNVTNYSPPDWEIDMSLRMMTYWTNFAKSGNPNEPISKYLMWPQYTLETQQHIIFDMEDSTGQYIYARELQFWNNLRTVYEELTHAQTLTSSYSKDEEGTCDKDGTCG